MITGADELTEGERLHIGGYRSTGGGVAAAVSEQSSVPQVGRRGAFDVNSGTWAIVTDRPRPSGFECPVNCPAYQGLGFWPRVATDRDEPLRNAVEGTEQELRLRTQRRCLNAVGPCVGKAGA